MRELRRGWLYVLVASGRLAGAAGAGELLYSTEGNRLRRSDVDTIDARPLHGADAEHEHQHDHDDDAHPPCSADPRHRGKCLVCHRAGKSGKTLSVGEHAVRAHLHHGDRAGACTKQGRGRSAEAPVSRPAQQAADERSSKGR